MAADEEVANNIIDDTSSIGMSKGSNSIQQAEAKEADEIERFLLGKLNDLILQVCKNEKKPLLSQAFKLPTKFQTLQDIIANHLTISTSSSSTSTSTSTSTRISREDLYNINNLLSEWQSKDLSLIGPDALLLSHSLNKIIQRLPQPPSPADKSQSHSHPCVGDSNTNNGEQESEPQPESNGVAIPDGETIQDVVIPEAAYRWSNQYVDEKSVRGTKDKEVFLRRLILPQPPQNDDSVFRMFGLVGMRGIGKTTLAQMVFNHPDIRKHYLPRLWVCVSKQPDGDEDPRKAIVKRILNSLGVEDEIIDYADTKHGLKGLLYALRQQLLGKRYLILLDDVHIEDKEYLEYISNLNDNIRKCEVKEKLAYALPKENGGAMIVTSRSKEIAKKLIGEENLHRVLPLSGEDCWEIFRYTYEKERKLMSNDMKSLENKIKEKCRGLPLAAKMMGEIARNRNQNDGTK